MEKTLCRKEKVKIWGKEKHKEKQKKYTSKMTAKKGKLAGVI